MPELTVRPATLSDLVALIAVDDLAVAGSQRWDQLHRAVTGQGCRILVAERVEGAAAIVGYVVVAAKHFFGRDFIELVMVAGQERRQGVAAQLIDEVLEVATTSTVFTSTNESNTAMRTLLASKGWVVSGTLDGLDDGDPEVVYYAARGNRNAHLRAHG